MHAYFDSPETIRNKIKEFKTATLGGLNKQDVMNYLSLLSEQQGVMIRLLRENNIPLFVDDGYEQEEQFMKPMGDGQDGLNLSQYLTGDNNANIAEMQAEIEALRAENAALKLASYNESPLEPTSTQEDTVSDFDSKYGIGNSIEDEKAALLQSIEEKDLYIKELENALQDNSSLKNNLNLAEDSSNQLSDIERQAYEEEILNLRNQLDSYKREQTEGIDLFNTEVVPLNEDIKESYEREIESLRNQLEEALSNKKEKQEMTDFDLMFSPSSNEELPASDENVSLLNQEVESLKSEVESLNSTIENLNGTINELQYELDTCHELLDEQANSVKSNEEKQDADSSLESIEKDNSKEEIENLKTNIEILEIEVSKREKEKASLELQLAEVNEKLTEYTSFEDENGNLVTLEPKMLSSKYNEILEIENRVILEKQDVENKLNLLKDKEALIEANKHLVSEDFINTITKKEQEIDSLRKQMDKMLLVAQATADATETEAKDKADKLVEDAKNKAESIINEAISKKEELLNEATLTLNSAKEFKTSTEEELANFREETRQDAEEMILKAQTKANEVLQQAQDEAQKSQENALKEVEEIMSKAEQKVSEIEALIQSKQKEIDKIQTYYLKVKNDGLVRVKQLYNQLENIIYSDDIS